MKRLIKPILILLVLCLICASGCKAKQDPEEFMFERVSKIPIEIPGYKLTTTEEADKIRVETSGNIKAIVDEREINIGIGVNASKFIISDDDTEFILDEEYMKTNSAYETVRTTWNAYREDYSFTSRYKLFGATVYDNKIFIVARDVNWMVAYGSYPITFYCLDLNDYKLYYAGYYAESYSEMGLKVISTF